MSKFSGLRSTQIPLGTGKCTSCRCWRKCAGSCFPEHIHHYLEIKIFFSIIFARTLQHCHLYWLCGLKRPVARLPCMYTSLGWRWSYDAMASHWAHKWACFPVCAQGVTLSTLAGIWVTTPICWQLCPWEHTSDLWISSHHCCCRLPTAKGPLGFFFSVSFLKCSHIMIGQVRV